MPTAPVPILTEETDPFCLPPADAARRLANAPWRRFATVGDSLAAGTGDPSPGYASLGWPDRLADILRRVHPSLEYLKTARMGATSADTLAEQLDAVTAFGPDLLHISCGANDIWRLTPDFAEIEQNLGRVFKAAASSGAQVTTFTLGKAFMVPKYPDWRGRVGTLNDIIRRLAHEHDVALVDMWSHPVNGRPGLLSADRIHFSASGQAVMAAEVVRRLAAVLERAAGQPSGRRREAESG